MKVLMRHNLRSLIMTVLCITSQLKILLDQVDEAVGDFDECILLRPDSALAQAQKCFALVSNQRLETAFLISS